MKDYQNETCVKLLEESQQQAIKWFKYRPKKKKMHNGIFIIILKNMDHNFILILRD